MCIGTVHVFHIEITVKTLCTHFGSNNFSSVYTRRRVRRFFKPSLTATRCIRVGIFKQKTFAVRPATMRFACDWTLRAIRGEMPRYRFDSMRTKTRRQNERFCTRLYSPVRRVDPFPWAVWSRLQHERESVFAISISQLETRRLGRFPVRQNRKARLSRGSLYRAVPWA